jgi:AraC family transcriptional regulator
MGSWLSRGQFFGSRLGCREVGGFTLTEYEYPPNIDLQRHGHEQAYFCLVLQGGYAENCGRKTRAYSPMTVTFHPAGEVHSDRFEGAGGRIFSVEIQPSWMRRVPELSPVLKASPEFRGGSLAALVVGIYKEFRNPDSLSHLAIEGLALEVVAASSRRLESPGAGAPPRWLKEARELIQERFAEPLTLGAIAAQAGVHPMHLVREFRRYFQTTVGEYMRRQRIEYACRLLAASDIPLIEIALQAGFSHHSHFTRIFKRATGMTPTEFRAVSGSRSIRARGLKRDRHGGRPGPIIAA